jgi:hypothetical protein
MNQTLKTGVAIGGLCTAWNLVMGFTGWYKHPVLLNLFWLVILIEIALLLFGLRRTAAAGQRYGAQLLTGTLMSAVAAVVIFAGSLLFTMVVFPNYFQELRATYEQVLRASGKSPAEIETAIRQSMAGQTPLVQAVQGAAGTLVTGFLASAVIGVFHRAR